MKNNQTLRQNPRSGLLTSPQFWSIAFIFILITMHHYNNLTNYSIFLLPDQQLGITRHTIDRILYLIPIILSSFMFGPRGGGIALVLALAAMLPRAVFIATSVPTALLETFMVTIIGASAPIWAGHNVKQQKHLAQTMERLENTQQQLDTKVQLTIEQERQLAVIKSFAAILSQSLDIKSVVHTAISMVKEIMQVEVVLVFSLDQLTQDLRIVDFDGVKPESALALDGMRLGEGLCGSVAKTGQPIATEDIADTPEFCNPVTLEEGLRAKLSVPLMARGEIIGTLCIATRTERSFKEPEIRLLSALGNLIGIAVDNSRLFHEKELSSVQLKSSEMKYRTLFENTHVAIWVEDLCGKITAANRAASQLFGYDLEDLIGTTSKDFLLEDSQMHSETIKSKLLSGEEERLPYMESVIKKDGSTAFIRVTTNLVSTNGHPDGFQFIGRDITNEVRMQENQQFYLEQITKAHEDERLRISRDLHDSAAQDLIAGLHQLEEFCEGQTNLPKEELSFLWALHSQLKNTLHDIRRLSRNLRPSIIDDLGIIPAVEWLTEQITTESNIATSLEVRGDEHRLAPEIEVALFRIVQEALRNVVKHADATEARVSIEFGDDGTKITVADNGKGFEMPASLGEFSRLGKLGIDGMQTRARLAGGSFAVNSGPGRGTTIAVTIPA